MWRRLFQAMVAQRSSGSSPSPVSAEARRRALASTSPQLERRISPEVSTETSSVAP